MDTRLMGHLRAVALTVFLLSSNWALAAAAPESDGSLPLQEMGGGCTPVIQVTPESLDFGDVAIGGTSQLNISIEDVETGPTCSIEIQNITLDSGAPNFELLGLGGFPFSIPVGTPFTFQVRFAPPSSGPFTGQITITSDDPVNPTVTVALSGNGVKNQLPICNAGGPYTGNVNEEITFDGSGSSDPEDGKVDTYAWDFGDGTSGSGTTPSHTYTAGGTFTVTLRVTDSVGGFSDCETTATIEGKGGDSITVTAPNGGEEFSPGETTQITWNVAGTGVPTVDIAFSADGGTTFVPIGLGEANDGTFDWLVPGNASTTQGLIQIQDSADGDPTDVSDAQFTINGVEVTRPNGGENFAVNSVEAITWDIFGAEITNVRIELSTDAGFTFTDIAATTENDGTFDWTVTGPPTTEALVRISDAANKLANDISDAVFNIVGEGQVPPICNAGGPYNGSVNIPVAFDGSGSSDDGTIVSYVWDFGDGSTDTGPTPTHTYTQAGKFPITLTVTDDTNLSSTCKSTATITEVGGPPICDANGPYDGLVNESIPFDGSGSSDDGTIVSYVWDFGDGSTDTGPTPTHTYTQAGKFPVTLTVTDDTDLSSTCTSTATITGDGPQPPICDANGPYDGLVNESIPFDGSGSSDPDGTIVSYLWDFGDGSTDTGPTPTHTYTQAGKFPVTLTVTDDTNLSSTCTSTATITGDGPQPPICDANGPYDGLVDESIQFDGTGSSDPDGTIVSYAWDFGDGSTDTGPTPTHTYTQQGKFPVTLTVTDDTNLSSTCTSTATITKDGEQFPPECNAGGPYTGTVNEAIDFDATGSQDPDGTIVAYHWDFGDGSTDDSGSTPSHTYTTTGTFTVTLTVTDDDNLSSTCTTEANVLEAGEVVRVALPEETFGNPGTDVTIPVFVLDDLTGLGVFSAEFTIEYDRRVLRARDVSFAGTIGEGATVEVDVDNLGSNREIIRVSAAWVNPLEGCEELAFVLFQATEQQTDRETDLDLEITFNEGTPEATDQDGTFIKGLLGDVNCSTNLSALDAAVLLRETIGLIELPDSDFPCFNEDTGDVSGNGTLSAFDASLILRFILGEIDQFPAEENNELQCDTPARAIAAARLSRALSLAAGAPAADGTYEVRVSIDDLAQVFGADLVLEFDPAQVRVLAVTPALQSAENVIVESRIGDGEVQIGIALAGARSGSTELVRLTVAPVGAATGGANQIRLARASLNEGAVETNVKAGSMAGAPIVREVALAQNRPNPFNPATVIAFAIPTSGRVELSVYDAAGRRVRTLVSSSLPAGEHQAQWDGRDDSGHQVAAGVYLSFLDAAGTQMTRKMILLK
jgi:PKD repeat protein